MSGASSPSAFRLQTGRVTVLLGPESARRGLLARLDPAVPGALTVASARGRSAAERIAGLHQAAGHRPAMVLVDRLTDGLTAAERRSVLDAVRELAAGGPAVLVDDADPVAALAVADAAFRAEIDGSVAPAELCAPLQRAE